MEAYVVIIGLFRAAGMAPSLGIFSSSLLLLPSAKRSAVRFSQHRQAVTHEQNTVLSNAGPSALDCLAQDQSLNLRAITRTKL